MARSSTTWQKGCPPPNGHVGRPPAGRSPTTLLRRALEQEHTPGVSRMEYLIEAAVQGLVRDAAAGDLPLSALLPVLQRLDGAPVLNLTVDEARERLAEQDHLRERADSRAAGARNLAAMRAHAAGLF